FYDSTAGRLTEKVNPSALASAALNSTTFAVGLTANSSGTGLVQFIDYGGSTTTATSSAAGDVSGYVKDHIDQNGLTTTSSNWTYLDYELYFQDTSGSVTVDPI